MKKEKEKKVKNNEKEVLEKTDEIKEEVKDVKPEEKDPKDEEILDLKNKVSELEDKLIRNNAELINYRKRKDEELSRLLNYSNEDIALELLPIVDNFERAINMDDDNLEDEVSKFLEGFKIIYKGLVDTLNKFEIKEINPLGEEFDPNYHMAVMTDSIEDKDDNIVLEVMQKGYMLKDKVIRPAMVKVNKN